MERWLSSRRFLLVGFFVMLTALAVVACGDDDGDETATATPGGGGGDTSTPAPGAIVVDDFDYDSLGGEIRIDGSSTVFPISEAVAEEFSQVTDTRVNVAFSGTGGGFEKFCRGETQISNASRPVKDSELEACAANDIDDVVELQVAIDALTVMVNPANDFATCMTVDELHQVFATDGAARWNEVRADWPDQSIVKYYPGTDSGTFDYFVEAIIEGVDENASHTGDGTASEDDNILAQGIENDDYAVGYFGFAYFLEAGQALKAVAIDGGDGCIEPSFDAALDGTYQPLARPLFIYTRESFLAENPEILGFINFYLDNLDVLVPEVGYVTMPADLKAEQVSKIQMYLDGETVAAEEAMDGIDYSSLGGEIRIDGSSTVFPISEAVAEEFSQVAGTRVNVAFSGTGGGFEKFCRGETQISDASRPIKDDEVQACADAGIDDIVELQVAIDALTVMVHPSNDFATCMTVDELHQVFATDGATRWNEVRADWPDESIVKYYPGTDSGTFDYFVEAIIEGVADEATHTGDGTASEDDNILAQGIENDDYAIGYFGFAYFLEAGDALNSVAIDGGDGCIAPSFDAALDGTYQPLARPLFIYTRESLLEERPEVLGFINFYLENLETLVPEVGYVTMPADLKAQQVAKVEPFLGG